MTQKKQQQHLQRQQEYQQGNLEQHNNNKNQQQVPWSQALERVCITNHSRQGDNSQQHQHPRNNNKIFSLKIINFLVKKCSDRSIQL